MATKSTENKDTEMATQEDHYPLTLDEFCQRLSTTDRRVELIGAFEHMEKRAGHLKDIETAYRSRYEKFVNQPV